MELEVSRPVLDGLIEEARAAHPRECCGLLMGDGHAVTALRPAANIHPRPEQRFEIDPQVLVAALRAQRRGALQVIGYYHSHPAGAAMPSATDRREAPHDGRVWAIVAGDAIGFWRDTPDGFEPLPYVVRPA